MTTIIGKPVDLIGVKGEDAATIATPSNPLPVVLASGSITLPPEVEIKNDLGNPVPVDVSDRLARVLGHVQIDNFPLSFGATQSGAWVVGVNNFPSLTSIRGYDGSTIMSRDNFVAIGSPQVVDANNTHTLTNTGATWTASAWTRTRSIGFVRQLVVIASTVSSGLGGTFTFQYGEDDGAGGVTITISEPRTITDFATVRDFDLINAGEWFRLIFTPSRTLTVSEFVFINTTQMRAWDGPFVRLANQEIEEANAAMGQTFAYLKAFDPITGKSTNIRPDAYGSLNVAEPNKVITQSGSQFVESIRDDISVKFDVLTSTATILSKIQNVFGGSGTFTRDLVEGRGVFSTSAAPGSITYWESIKSAVYEPGHEIVGEQTIYVSGALTGDYQVDFGFALDDGTNTGTIAHSIGMRMNASGISYVRRKNGVDVTVTPRSSFNRDKLDGSNGSKYRVGGTSTAINLNSNLLWRYVFEWLGIAPPTIKIMPPQGGIIPVNVEETPGQQTGTTVPTPQLKLFVRIKNDSTSGGVINVACGSWRGGIHTSKAVGTGINPNQDFVDLQVQGNDPGNISSALLAANGVFRGKWFNWQKNYVAAVIDMVSDVSGTLYVDFSEQDAPVDGDETSVDDSAVLPYSPSDLLYKRTIPVQSKWIRLRFVNGIAAQAKFYLDVAYLTASSGLVLAELAQLPKRKTISGYVRNVQAIPTADGSAYQEVPVSSGGHPMVHVQAVDTPVYVQPPTSGPQTRQFVLTQTAQRIDLPDVTGGTGYRFVEVRNAGVFHAFVKEDNTITELNSQPIFLAGNALYGLTPGDQLWAICENTGAGSLTTNFYGTTGTTGAITSNDTRATQTAAGQTIYAEGYSFSFSPGYTEISRLRLGIEVRKQSGQFETGTYLQSAVGAAGAVGTIVTSTSLTGGAGRFYLAAISREVGSATTATITSVTGLGLTWTQVATLNSDDNKRRIDVWSASGTSITDPVTATFATNPTSSRIAVHAYSNISAIQAFGTAVANSASVVGPTLACSNKGYSYLAVAIDNATSTPGTGYTEITDQSGTTGTSDNLMTENKALTAGGTESATATLSAAKHYAAIGVTLIPINALNPTTTLTYNYNGNPGATSDVKTISSTVDDIQYLDITSDFTTITPADIALIRGISTSVFVSGAQIETDAIFLEITQTSNAITRIAVTQVGGQA